VAIEPQLAARDGKEIPMSGKSTLSTLGVVVALCALVALGPGSTGAGAQQQQRMHGPVFSLDCAPREVPVPQGGSGNAHCMVFSLLPPGDPTVPVQLRCEGLPPGMGCTFTPNPVMPVPEGSPSALEIGADTTVTPGRYAIAAVGTDGMSTLYVPMFVTVTTARADCVCTKVALQPDAAPTVTGTFVAAHKDENGDPIPDTYKVEVKASWKGTITCSGGNDVGRCKQDYDLTQKSVYKIDGPTDGKTASESFNEDGGGGGAVVTCAGKCDPENETTAPFGFKTIYKADVQNSSGGSITQTIDGRVELVLTPKDPKCDTRVRSMVVLFAVAYNAKKKAWQPPKIHEPQSDFDGDGWSNAQERARGTDALNPDTDGDGYDDTKGQDKFPLDKDKH